jgi:hypothetical protein
MVTVEVDETVWRYLMSRKRPGDSHNDVLRREFGLDDATDAESSQHTDSGGESGAVSRARAALAEWEPSEANSQKARAAVAEVVGWLDGQDAPQQRGDVLAWPRAIPTRRRMRRARCGRRSPSPASPSWSGRGWLRFGGTLGMRSSKRRSEAYSGR